MVIPKSTQLLVWSSLVATFFYAANIIVGGLLNPGYSHARQFASELGKTDAAHPILFSAGSITTGIVFFAVAIGLWRSLASASRRPVLAGVSGLFMALFGVNLIFAGAFPLPNRLHGAFGVALLTFFIPWLVAWALWKTSASRLSLTLQIIATPAILLTAIFQTGLLGGVDGTNIGFAQRVAAAVFFVWLLLTAQWLKTLLSSEARAV